MPLSKFVAYFELENNCPLLFLISYQSLFEASRCHLQTCFCPTTWQSRWHSVISLSQKKCINLKIWILGGPVWDSLTCPYNLIWKMLTLTQMISIKYWASVRWWQGLDSISPVSSSTLAAAFAILTTLSHTGESLDQIPIDCAFVVVWPFSHFDSSPFLLQIFPWLWQLEGARALLSQKEKN